MELINKDTPQVKEFISSLNSMLDGIESIVKHYKPHLNGERFLSNNEVSKKLNVSLRTLQEWRDTGLIPFIQIKGKIIYRQSDIDKLLQSTTLKVGKNNYLKEYDFHYLKRKPLLLRWKLYLCIPNN